ncbi:MAG TPA: hypothetical protein VHE35_36940, partial [Kofleriaceae bacterium]|nr:hypothetical protein [Kofleriaceae bacterium]
YYDRRRTDYDNYFNQTTFGGELLGRDWEFRGNVYLPFGERVKNVDSLNTAEISGTSVIFHGGEERALRVVRACIAGPGVAPGRGGPIHITDLSRAIADSLAVRLPDSSGRPLAAALAAPVGDDDVLPRLPAGRVAAALAILFAAAALTGWVTRARLALLPWWFVVAAAALCVTAQVPTLSTPMIYPPQGLTMAEAFAPGLAVLALACALSARGPWLRGLVGQLALPLATALALAVVTGALPLVVGHATCPAVPRWTGWLSPVLLMAATGAGVAGVVTLVGAALPR